MIASNKDNPKQRAENREAAMLLKEAKRLIEERGWHNDTYSDGERALNPLEACRQAAYCRSRASWVLAYSWLILATKRPPFNQPTLAVWNNSPGITKVQILEGFDASIALANKNAQQPI